MLKLSIFFLGLLAGVAIFIGQRAADEPTDQVVVRGLTDAVSTKRAPKPKASPTPEPTAAASQTRPVEAAPVAPGSTPIVVSDADDAKVITDGDDLVATFKNHNGGDTPDASGKGSTRDDDVDPPDDD